MHVLLLTAAKMYKMYEDAHVQVQGKLSKSILQPTSHYY